jgi:RNA polymerase sigma factor (TIGR02999 family)
MPDAPESPLDPTGVLPLIYEELRRVAAGYMQGERPAHTLQPTALVHEAYIRLVGNTRLEWKSKTHIVAMAAIEMRRILIEYARMRNRSKRGQGAKQITLDESVAVTSQPTVDIVALDEALQKLAKLDLRQSRVAELHLFSGLSQAELAEHLGVSERTVREDWRVARAWLARHLAA